MGRTENAAVPGSAPVAQQRRPVSVIISSYFLNSKGHKDQYGNRMLLQVPASDGAAQPDLNGIMRKVSRVLMPVCFLAGVLNYLDRTNLNFAALQLNAELGFTPQDYGLGAGFFSLGYGIGHVPSTFVTMRCGARWWYSTITIAWGVVATCGAVINNRSGLFAQRFFLGITEAGAIPSALHLMSQFYPVNMRTKPFTAVTLANVVSVVFAAPLAAGLMSMEGLAGLRGWQWLFIIEGLPSVLLGLAMLVVVPNHPLSAWFLKPEERVYLHYKVHEGNTVAAEAAKQQLQWKQMITLTVEAVKMPLLWFFSIAGFLWVLCVFSLNSWIAIIIKNMLAGTALQGSSSSGGNSAVNTLHATLLSAIPYFCAAVAMWCNALSSERFSERTLHVGLPCVFGGIILTLFEPLYRASFVAGFAVLVIAMMCAYSGQSVMFARVTEPLHTKDKQALALLRSLKSRLLSLPVSTLCLLLRCIYCCCAESLDTKHAGVGLAVFNAVGAAIGGFSGPWIVGALVGRLGSFVPAMVFMGVFLIVAGVMISGFGVWEWRHKRAHGVNVDHNRRVASVDDDSKNADSVPDAVNGSARV